ncbi:MAG: carbohydrate ABC transporter permease [Spirochaetia bacterium]
MFKRKKTLTGERLYRKIVINTILVIIAIVWTVPTLGLLVTSFRTPEAIHNSGWWTAFADLGSFSLDNYQAVIFGEYSDSAGNVVTASSINISTAFLNSLTVTIPAVIIPILIAALAAYGIAWLRFPGRKFFFAAIIGCLVFPLQISLIPILRDFQQLQITGSYLAIWFAHTGFALPLATYLLFNFISTIPKSIIESGKLDGASHFTIFFRLIVPLSVPALAAFAIFQFLWVWNDLLLALVFLSGTGGAMEVLTQRLLNMVGQYGQDWQLLTAAAFISMILPLIVFFTLQKFFIRGLVTGSVKE